MTKYILFFLFVLLNLYNCEKEDKVKIYDVILNQGKTNEFNVKKGEEFALRLFCSPGTNSLILLNKKENQDSLTYIKSDYEIVHYEGEELGLGRMGYLYYYFKATSETEEPKLIKFTDAYTYLQKENPTPTEIVKINVN